MAFPPRRPSQVLVNADASPTDRQPPLRAARAAIARGEWAEARELYQEVLAADVTPEALEGFALASWWLDDVDAAIDARERAYAIRRDRGETLEAGWVATYLAWDYGAIRGHTAVANGWLQRARRLLDESGAPAGPELAWMSLIEASFHLDTDANEVLRLSTDALTHAKAHGVLDVEMTARTLQGLALVTLGRVSEGNALLDEGTAAATAGELRDPFAIGSCCCNMIIACERSRDFDRAGQWCERLAEFCERTGQRPLLALCRAHYGTVLTMRGEWTEAEEELEWAAGELSTLRPVLAGYARARLAELRRRQGRTREARELLAAAEAHVLVPLVQAQLALDDDDASAALSYAEKFLRSFGSERAIESAGGFETLVLAHLRLGEVDRARDAHAELAAIAEAVGTDALRGANLGAQGWIALTERRPGDARGAFEDAIEHFDRGPAPFEAAQMRMGLARALDAEDRRAAAIEHAGAAAAALDGLGARRLAQSAHTLVERLGGRSAGRRHALTTRERDVLVLVAKGRSNREIASDLVVSEHTVHRHLANIYTKLGVTSRAAAVAAAADLSILD